MHEFDGDVLSVGGVRAATKGEQVRIESETRVDFRLEESLEVTLK